MALHRRHVAALSGCREPSRAKGRASALTGFHPSRDKKKARIELLV